MKRYFKFIGVVLLTYFVIQLIMLIFIARDIIAVIGKPLFILLLIFFIVFEPSLGLLFYHVGSMDDSRRNGLAYREQNFEEKDLNNINKSFFNKVNEVANDPKVRDIVNGEDSVFDKTDKLKDMYDKGIINKATYDDAIYRVKSRSNEEY